MDEMKNNNEMERLYAETFQSIQVGALLHGRVIAVKSENVIVDVGYKSEGYVRSEEFSDEELRALRPEMPFEVYVEQVRDAEGSYAAFQRTCLQGKDLGRDRKGLSGKTALLRALLPRRSRAA